MGAGKVSTSCPLEKLLVMETVAPVRFALSTSVTVRLGAMATGEPFSVKETVPPAVTTGASLTEVTVTELVVLPGVVPSVAVQVMVRVRPDGFCDVFWYVTLRRTVWYAATE